MLGVLTPCAVPTAFLSPSRICLVSGVAPPLTLRCRSLRQELTLHAPLVPTQLTTGRCLEKLETGAGLVTNPGGPGPRVGCLQVSQTYPASRCSLRARKFRLVFAGATDLGRGLGLAWFTWDTGVGWRLGLGLRLRNPPLLNTHTLAKAVVGSRRRRPRRSHVPACR